MKVLLLSTYDMGRQPFGLASPAAWLRRDGMDVESIDLSRDELPASTVRAADLVAFHLPMHTATRLAARVAERVRRWNPQAHLCFYGLYAPVNETYLRRIGAETILGGEFEPGLAALAQRLSDTGRHQGGESHPPHTPQSWPVISLDRLQFLTPDRQGLPDAARYARLHLPDGGHRVTGYTEASRGCKHLCRHCPVVPVYQGAFRIVQKEVVIEDIARQAAAGSEHIVFGDPDFFNGPAHAMAIVEELHRRFPRVTYEVTIKIEHLLKHAHLLPALRDTGCLLVTSAVESVDDGILVRLEKGHTRADFLRVIAMFRDLGMVLNPTFVPFTPWTTLEGYRDLLGLLAAEDLVYHVAPVQLAIRLLIPAGSRLLASRSTNGRTGRARARCCHRRPAGEIAAGRDFHAHRQGGRFAGLSRSIVARRDSVSQRALVLLSGTCGRAVCSSLIAPMFDSPMFDSPRSDPPMFDPAMKRVLLLSTTTGYQAGAVLRAAAGLGVQVTLGTDRCHVLEDPWGDGAIALRFEQPEQNAEMIAVHHAATPFDGLVAIGDAPAETAALAAQRLKIPFHTPQAARASRNKLLSRRILRDAGLPVPFFCQAPAEDPPAGTPFPCVLKPAAMSASRGVIRADNPAEFRAAHRRILAMVSGSDPKDPDSQAILVEGFIPGRELAIEGIVEHGHLHTLAIFDKPDPLDGPYFEETIYVTPSRLDPAKQQELVRAIAQACAALGLLHGPIHAEARWNERGAWVLEVAARPIGGLCARALHFGGETLESLILRHALGESLAGFARDRAAAGVMMIPIPEAGVYAGVDGVEAALAVPGVTGMEITAKPGERLIPWPEGSSYLGFIFAGAETPEEVEGALRAAHGRLKFAIQVSLPVVR
jgi:radical SAM superfamily enzyme YgiQ (UPF0313 family)/biotin carboxylase